MALLPTQIEQIDNLTLSHFEKSEYTDISLDKTNYVLDDALRGKGRKVARAGGKNLVFKIKTDNLGSFRQSGLFGIESTENYIPTTEATVPWAKQIVGYNWDVDEEAFNGSAAQIVDAIQMRIDSCWQEWYDGMEEAMWTAPTSSSQNPMPLMGIPFWVQNASATSTAGFNGGNPSGFTAGAGGVSSTAYTKWKNMNATYATVDYDDFLKKLAYMMDHCNFKPPRALPELGGGDPDWGLYSVYAVIEPLRDAQRTNNDNIGRDLGEYSGDVTFRRIPIKWVPALDTDSAATSYVTNNPLYGINWKTLHYVFQQGKDMVKSPAITPNKQPSVRERWMWRWGQFRCYNRRKQFVMVQA